MISREKMVEECSKLTGLLTEIYPSQVDEVFFNNLTQEELIREYLQLSNQYEEMIENYCI